jgi:hypothetical protein
MGVWTATGPRFVTLVCAVMDAPHVSCNNVKGQAGRQGMEATTQTGLLETVPGFIIEVQG